MAKLSGPLLDRFDLIIDVAAIAPIQLLDSASGQQSKDIKARIEQARRFALDRAKEVQLKAQNFGAEPQADDLSDALNDEAKQFIR